MLPNYKYREIIRTHAIAPELSLRALAKLNNCSYSATRRVIKRAEKYKLDLPSSHLLKDSEIKETLYPDIIESEARKRPIDIENIYRELCQKKRKTITVLYIQYRAIDPSTAYSKSHFFLLVRTALKKRKLAMRQQHIAGDVVYIDYAGTKMFYEVDDVFYELKVFVGCLGASKKLFALATPGETTQDWLEGMQKMFEYFGGVTKVISIDNAKALVTKAKLLPLLNQNLERFAEHYGCIFDGCRVGSPQDKSLAELGVKFITQRILRPAKSDCKFKSPEEANEYLQRGVEALNNENFQRLNTTRNQLFEDIEKRELSPLPERAYEYLSQFQKVKVPSDYHILHKQHYYSVPHTLANEQVIVRVINNTIIISFDHEIVAVHQIKRDINGCTTLTEHLSPEHRAESLKTREEYLSWANSIGQSTVKYVQWLYTRVENPNSRAVGKQCQHLVKVSRKTDNALFDFSCRYALEHEHPPSEISLVISSIDSLEDDSMTLNVGEQRYLRGSEYYGGRHDRH